jgi:hypothetical protein
MSLDMLQGISKREALQLLRRAYRLPALTQETDATLVLTFSQRSLGWTLEGQSHERSGPALDVTGATVKLHGRRVLDMGPEWGTQYRLSLGTAFEITGTLTDASDGKVTFAISRTAIDGASGVFLLEPRITFADGSQRVPRLLSFQLEGRVS